MATPEIQQLWEQQIKQKVLETLQPKLSSVIGNKDTANEINQVINSTLQENGITPTDNILVEIQLDLNLIETDGTAEQAESVIVRPMICVYYPRCPTNDRTKPCMICS